MPNWQKLWQTIDRLQTLIEPKARWKQMLGENWEFVEPWLTLQPDLATVIPHPTKLGSSLRIIDGGTHSFIGVDDETGDSTPIRKTDLVTYRLDSNRFAKVLAGAFGWEVPNVRTTSLPYCDRIGAYQPLAGYSFNVYLSFIPNPYGRAPTIGELAMLDSGPFILVVPSHRSLRDRDMDWLRSSGSLILPLDFAFELKQDRTIGFNLLGDDLLKHFDEQHLPQVSEPTFSDFFPTPTGASWSDVHMRLVDGETVAVSVQNCRKTLTFAQLGLASSRNARPTKQWRLLETYARNYGTITWTSSGAAASVKKQTQLLSAKLKAYFRIEGRPIEFDQQDKCYTACFRIESA